MTGPNGREPIDLGRYKKAVQDRARAESEARRRAAARPSGAPRRGPQPFLGSRPHAGLILVLAIAAFLALWFGPMLL